MLKRVTFDEKYQRGAPCALLLGGFDGMHVGHRTLLAAAKGTGLPVGVMAISGGKGEDLFTFEEREEIFSSLGAAFAFELPFSEIRDLSPAEFADLLVREFSRAPFSAAPISASAKAPPARLNS